MKCLWCSVQSQKAWRRRRTEDFQCQRWFIVRQLQGQAALHLHVPLVRAELSPSATTANTPAILSILSILSAEIQGPQRPRSSSLLLSFAPLLPFLDSAPLLSIFITKRSGHSSLMWDARTGGTQIKCLRSAGGGARARSGCSDVSAPGGSR